MWISVTDSLPDSDITVIIYRPESSNPIDAGFHDGNVWCDYLGADLGGVDTVTHWMHFPEPPKEPEEYPWSRNDTVLVSILGLVGITVDEAIVTTWTDVECQLAEDYGCAAHIHASDHDDVEVPPMPEFLNKYIIN